MGQYRFVGAAPAQILDTPYNFTCYGQLVEMDDAMAIHAAAGHINIIPAEEFVATAEELKQFSRFDKHSKAPQSFLDNRSHHWDLAAAYHQNPESIVKSTQGGK